MEGVDTSMAFDLSPDVVTATEETQVAQDTVDAVAGETMANANPPSLGESGIDSAVLDQAMAALDADKAAPVADDVAPEQPVQKQPVGSRSQQRIQQLVQERNAERERAARLEMQFAETQKQIAAQQAEFQRQQLAIEERRLKMQEDERRLREEAMLPDVEKAKRKFLSEAEVKAEERLSPRLQALEQELLKERQWREQLTAQADQQARFQKIDQMGKQVLDGQLLKDYTPEERATLAEPMEEMLHAFSGAYKAYPNQVAPKFQEFLNKWFVAEAHRRSRTVGAKVAQTKAAPAPLPNSRGASSNGAETPFSAVKLDQLRRNGFDSHVAWFRAGRPALK